MTNKLFERIKPVLFSVLFLLLLFSFMGGKTPQDKKNAYDLMPSVLLYKDKVLLKDNIHYDTSHALYVRVSKNYTVVGEEKEIVKYYEQALVKEGWSKFEMREDRSKGKGDYARYYDSQKNNLKFTLSFDDSLKKSQNLVYRIYVKIP